MLFQHVLKLVLMVSSDKGPVLPDASAQAAEPSAVPSSSRALPMDPSPLPGNTRDSHPVWTYKQDFMAGIDSQNHDVGIRTT